MFAVGHDYKIPRVKGESVVWISKVRILFPDAYGRDRRAIGKMDRAHVNPLL